MSAIIAVVLVGLVVGLLANALFRHHVVADESEGLGLDTLIEPVTILAALFIAFVLFGAAGTYSAAGTAASDEANVVDNMFEATEYIKQDRYKIGLQSSLVCYARAVDGPEFAAMRDGVTTTKGAIANNWTGTGPHGIRLKLQRMGSKHPLFDKMTAFDSSRGDTRRARLALAAPQVPTVISGFMLALVFASVLTLAFFIPQKRNGAHRVTVVVVGLVLVGSLALVRALDRPFSGILRIEPSAMTETSRQIGDDFAEAYPSRRLPCDREGTPLGRTPAHHAR